MIPTQPSTDRVMADEDREADERRANIIKLEPVTHIFVTLQGLL